MLNRINFVLMSIEHAVSSISLNFILFSLYLYPFERVEDTWCVESTPVWQTCFSETRPVVFQVMLAGVTHSSRRARFFTSYRISDFVLSVQRWENVLEFSKEK